MTAAPSRTIWVISALASAREPLGLSRLSERSGLARASLARLLGPLIEGGTVQVDDAGRYSLTTRVLAPGFAVLDQRRVREIAFPYLAELSAAISREVVLAIYEYPEVVFLERVFMMGSRVSSHLMYSPRPLLASHSGTLLLAFAPEAQQRELLRAAMPEGGPEAGSLADALRDCRRDQFSYWDGTPGNPDFPAGIAVPVFNAEELAVGTVTITHPSPAEPVFRSTVLPKAQEVARLISASLGSRRTGGVGHI